MNLAEQVLASCRAQGLKIATAESCTGGMVSAALTDVVGSSDVFERGFVTYSNEAKVEMLGVDPAIISEFGAVSAEVASQMATGALTHSNADIAISITGVAGPGASENKPEGLVWFGLAVKGQQVLTLKKQFGPLGRALVRQASVTQALSMLVR
ncbi:MAG: CinA family protein [Rhodobacteraceae bacterium]|nr:CinA family protein [Paracoccaceae bacterium]